MNIIQGGNYRTIRNETITVTEIHDDRVVGIITASPDAENINQHDIFRKTSLIAQENK